MGKVGNAIAEAGPLTEKRVTLLLDRLRSPDGIAGWEEFLLLYSSILYRTVRTFTQNEDEVSDCFVFICEQLAINNFRRLLKFKLDGRASFPTWLRVVARHLCYDWHRKRYGRLRPFKSIQTFSPLELEVYHWRYERGLSREATLEHLRATWPVVDIEDLPDLESRIENSLNSRQHWLLSAWTQRRSSQTISDTEENASNEMASVIDQGPNPEAIAIDRQQQAKLRSLVARLPPIDRLILHLRFEEDLSLEEIAGLTGLDGAQRVHRQIAAILQKLRTTSQGKNGKSRGVSVK
jgi:RNA polymerase sigma factor (sigma-70 family)